MITSINVVNGDVKIKFTYFKATGKWYSNGEETFRASFFEDCFSPKDAGRKLNLHAMLPGIGSGTWSNPFVVQMDGTYIELVV